MTLLLQSALFLFMGLIPLSMASLPNPIVTNPKNMTYSAGTTISIQWHDASTGFVNIDLVNPFNGVLPSQPWPIAAGVPGNQNSFDWVIPSALKTAVGYRIRVWGSTQPQIHDAPRGVSEAFTIYNNIPCAVTGFTILTPSHDHPCAINHPCRITWDFPTNSNNYPADVNIALYRVGQPQALVNIATVSSSKKEYTWQVPNDSSLLDAGNVVISVWGGSGVPPLGPKQSTNEGANSGAFKMQATLPSPHETSTKDDDCKCTFTTKTTSSCSPTLKIKGAGKKEKNGANEGMINLTGTAAMMIVLIAGLFIFA